MLKDILLFGTGFLVGGMNAVAGGGMLLGFPILLATGMPAITANATSYLVVLPGNIAAGFGYRKYLKRVPRHYLLLLIPTVIGGFFGTYLLRNTSEADFAKIIPWLILFAVLLFAYQPFLYNYLHNHLHGPAKLRRQVRPLVIVGLAMFPLSIYGGYFGAGFGFIMLAFLGFTRLHDHMHRMNALKNISVTFLAGVSVISLFGSHLIDWRHGLVMAGGNLLGGYIGAIYIQKVSSHSLRVFIVVIGLAAAAYLGLRTY
jgi:uncharacterized membrane protein YfcA